MIWGMTLEPGKLYTEIMGEEVQLSMAAIDSRKDLGETPSTNFCQIVIQTEKGEYVLCTLVHGIMFQQNLDLKLMPREKVTFSVQGPSVVYLVGYTASYPGDDEELRIQQDYEDDSSAWETLEEGDPAFTQIKEEPIEILDDDDDDDTEIGNNHQMGVQESAASDQARTEGGIKEEPRGESGAEMTFSVAVKTEAPDQELYPPVTSGAMMTPSQQQLPLNDNLYSMQTTDPGLDTTQAVPSQDFFYPEPQEQQLAQQSDIPLTHPVAFPPSTSGPDYQNPQTAMLTPTTVLPQTAVVPQTGVLPPTETFMQTQNPVVQRLQANPVRQSSPGARGDMPSANNQRTYPPQRRQYGTVRGKPPGRGRGKSPGRGRPRLTQQQNRNSMQQQQSVPGTSQQNIPGPSTSGPWLPSPANPPSIELPLHTGKGSQSISASSQDTIMRNSARGHIKGLKKTISDTEVQSQDFALGKIFCKFCAKPFTDEVKYGIHVAYHKRVRKFICDECCKAFHSNENLIRHKRIHTGERPYKCKVCGKRFTRQGVCKRHEQTHYKGSNNM